MPHCRTDGQGLTCGRGLPPPCRAAAWPTASPPGGSLLLEAKIRLKINFIYIKVPTARQEGGRGPAAPQPGGRGINL